MTRTKLLLSLTCLAALASCSALQSGPEKDKTYKVLKIRQTEVDIELPGGTKKTLTLIP